MPSAAAQHSRVIVLGSGPAGYTAAIYAARAMLEPMLIAGFEQGGQLMITTDVENYPGFAQPIQGPWLMDQMRAQAEHVGAKLVCDHIVEATWAAALRIVAIPAEIYTCDALIVATGAKARWLGLPSEEKFKGFGVSACATCDGFFFRGKKVLVVGGGNTAVEEALYLSNIASNVTLVHRRDTLRSESMLQERLRAGQCGHLLDHARRRDSGGRRSAFGHLRSREERQDRRDQTLEADGVFIAIGHSPATELFKGQLDAETLRLYPVEPGTTQTNIAGVFAAGDVADEIFRQAVTAAGPWLHGGARRRKISAGRARRRLKKDRTQ